MTFQLVKVQGQVTYAESNRVFLERDGGLEVLPAAPVDLRAGTVVEAVGYPAISATGPQLREAVVRRLSDSVLPPAPEIPDGQSPGDKFRSARIRITGMLADSGRLLGITLLDHVIFSKNGYYSFRENDDMRG